MGSVTRLALGCAFALAASTSIAVSPAGAQKRGAAAPAGPTFSKDEYTALAAAEAALTARNYPAATAALATAQSVARGGDARHHLAGLQLRLARETGNVALQSTAIEALIAGGRVQGAELGLLYGAQGAIASSAGNRDRAEAALTRALDLAPTPEAAINLARVKLDLRKNAEAVALVQRAIDLRRASGQSIPESWLRRGAALATISNLGPQSVRFTRELAAAYPSPQNWRDAVLTYRDAAKPDQSALLDSIRLMRLSKGLAGERDYLEAAQTFSAANLASESRSVLEEGVANGMVDPAKPTFKEAIAASARAASAERSKMGGLQASAMASTTGAAALQAGDIFLSAANYTAAAELFQAAVQKGAIDPNVANTRLGIALALAGRKAEADAAFRSVTGPRSELAALWLAWLGQRA